jgi:peptide/nickel transport system permease protein
MVGLATLDLGKSMWTDRPVVEEIAIRLELSLQVAVMASLVAVMIAIPLGTVAALMRGTWIDYVVRVITIAGLSIPSFWLGLLIMLMLLLLFNWLPPITFTPLYVDPGANLTQLIWPAMAVGYRYSAVTARMVRSQLLEVMNEDYIRTARAKGAGETRVVLGHALRNALIPVATVIALDFGTLFSGALVTESIFAYPGMGRLIYDAVMGNDFNLALVALLFATLLTLLANLAADVAYVALDPRVSFEERDA